MAVFLSPIGGAGWQFFNNDGTVLSGGKIYTYAAGTTTPKPSYTTSAGNIAHANPIILDSAGRVPGGEIWLLASTYKFVLNTSTDVLIASYDNISGIGAAEYQIQNFTGFGLYDRQFMDVLRNIQEPYPYFRGLVSELGFSICQIPYLQPKRSKGNTKNNFFTLYDMAMLGFTSHSKVPLRMSSFIGFVVAFLSILIATIYLIYKILFWDNFQVGIAPLVIGFFFFGGVQLFFLGIIGEYISAILTQVKNRPLVIEKERINF